MTAASEVAAVGIAAGRGDSIAATVGVVAAAGAAFAMQASWIAAIVASVVAVPPRERAWVDLTAVTSVAAAAGPRLPMETAAPKARVDVPPPVAIEVAAVAGVVEGGASDYVGQPVSVRSGIAPLRPPVLGSLGQPYSG